MTNIAMENSTFIDDFPIKTSIYKGFSMAMLNNQMVTISKTCNHNKSIWQTTSLINQYTVYRTNPT